MHPYMSHESARLRMDALDVEAEGDHRERLGWHPRPSARA